MSVRLPISTNSCIPSEQWQHRPDFHSYNNGFPRETSDFVMPRSILGSLKSSFKRKNSSSARSTTSRTSTGAHEPDSSFRGPVELPTTALGTLTISGSRSPVSPLAEPSPMAGTSPWTRRPDRPGMNAFTVPSNEPPPAYTQAPPANTELTLGLPPNYTSPGLLRSPSPTPSAVSTLPEQEDKYAFLSQFDTILLIDDSGSMSGRSWRETSQALSQLLPIIVSHDADGIDIFFLNHISSDLGCPTSGIAPGGYRNIKSVDDVNRIFKTVKPGGGTPTGTRCRAILRPYLNYLEAQSKKGKLDDVKPLNILTITDGVPSDDVESILLEAAKKLDSLEAAPHQVGVQFFQVGNEEGAAEALKELDDGLVDRVQGGVRDMVDTCTWMGGNSSAEGSAGPKLSAEGILKVVLGAVVKRLDRRRCSAEQAR